MLLKGAQTGICMISFRFYLHNDVNSVYYCTHLPAQSLSPCVHICTLAHLASVAASRRLNASSFALWIWGYSVMQTQLCRFLEGMSVDSLFKVSSERLLWVHIKDPAGPPKDIHRIVPKPLWAVRAVTFLKSKPQTISGEFCYPCPSQ